MPRFLMVSAVPGWAAQPAALGAPQDGYRIVWRVRVALAALYECGSALC